MGDLDAILRTWSGLGSDRSRAVIATVVHVTGSAYRRPGARMLVLPDGQRVGMVSGGCLEAEIVRKAWWLTESNIPVVRVYDTTSDDDAVWTFGLGCNGVVHVLLERTEGPDTAAMLEFLTARRQARVPVVVATVIGVAPGDNARIGDRLLVDAEGVAGGRLRGHRSLATVQAHAERALTSGAGSLVHLEGCDVFVEVVRPPQELVVFGAGDDARPLVEMACVLGWQVTVVDGRPAYARPERFPAGVVVRVLRHGDELQGVKIDAATAVVMMTHNYPLDVRLLPQLLARRPRYLGVLGPRHRAERLRADAGVDLPAAVYAPVGLDIGADDPAGVALSILAELQAVLGGRDGAMLRTRGASIHAPVTEIGSTAGVPAEMERPSYCATVVDEHAA